MASLNPANPRIEDNTFLSLLAVVSLAFGWILWPFYGAVLWGAILAILFAPLLRRLLRSMRGRKTAAALTAVAADLLDRSGLTSLGAVREKTSAGLMKGGQVLATRAIDVGQNAVDFIVNHFIVLYLLFFFLHDGSVLATRIRRSVSLDSEQQRELFDKFAEVIRATIKGSLVVALAQGALGGLIFWLSGVRAPVLWGAVMALFSLLPAVGAAMIWLPAAIYFLASSAIGKGVLLIAYGVLIGLIDHLLRPIPVGKETKMPNYVVLLSTLGGIAIFGLNDFVIGPVIAAMFIAVRDMVAASTTQLRQGGS